MGHGTDGVTTGSVVSADGTRIGYRRLGRGPSLILLHGGVNASQHMMKLGRALADAFTVYLPDRRGRGMSGAFGPVYSIQREDEDLAAIVEHTAAECVFGPANGGLFALHGAIGLGQSGGWLRTNRYSCGVGLMTRPYGACSPRCSA
jgi:pimeloyl-ACP methyl ester carboxylesterase